MDKILTLLKYLDRSKLTPAATQEIAKAFGFYIDPAKTAEVANAVRTRGPAGLLQFLPAFHKTTETTKELDRVECCPNCGRFFVIGQKD
jgi:hypothetical protein